MRLRLLITIITLALLPVMFAGCYGWTTTIYGIWGRSASDIFAVGFRTMLHYDGNTVDEGCYWIDMVIPQ